MQRAINFYKRHFEIANTVIISLMLAISCFLKYFFIPAAVFALIVAIFYDINQNIKMVLFFYPFKIICGAALDYIYVGVLLILLVKYIIEINKKQKRFNFKLFTILLVMTVYLLLPFHWIGFYNFSRYLIFYPYIYLIYEYRKELNFSEIVCWFSLAIVVSCAMGFLAPIAPYLDSVVSKVIPCAGTSSTRFAGLFSHPNNMATNILVAMSLLATLLYLNKVKFSTFCILFIPMYVFGFLSIARLFVVAFAVLMIVFVPLYAVKYKKQSVKPLIIILLLLAMCSIAMIHPAKLYLGRLDQGVAMPDMNFDEETWELIYNGKIRYDPGRLGLWKMYLISWAHSPYTILFGWGASGPNIGRMDAHNAFIKYLHRHGIVGYVLLAMLIIYMIDFKKLKANIAWACLAFIPIIATFMLDPVWVDQEIPLYIILFSIVSIGSSKEKQKPSEKESQEQIIRRGSGQIN